MLNFQNGAIHKVAMSILGYFPLFVVKPERIGLNSDSYHMPNGILHVNNTKLGQGTFGVVYSGKMTNGRKRIPIAVKYPLVICVNLNTKLHVKTERDAVGKKIAMGVIVAAGGAAAATVAGGAAAATAAAAAVGWRRR